jgi:hypothetical protein
MMAAHSTPPAGVHWPGGKPPSAAEWRSEYTKYLSQVLIPAQSSVLSGVNSDAILYLCPPDTFTQSPIEDSIYLDPDYFNEENRRARCCTPKGEPLDWDQIVRENSLLPKKLKVAR